jgi:predicted DNA-binding antitoxin AbrB/MazE fold protein
MTETITARYEGGTLVPLEDIDLEELQTVRLQIVPPQVCVTAATARRRANRFILDKISYLMGAEQPISRSNALPVPWLPVSHKRQCHRSDCLAACAAMILAHLGRSVRYSRLMRLLNVTPDLGAPASNIESLSPRTGTENDSRWA